MHEVEHQRGLEGATDTGEEGFPHDFGLQTYKSLNAALRNPGLSVGDRTFALSDNTFISILGVDKTLAFKESQ